MRDQDPKSGEVYSNKIPFKSEIIKAFGKDVDTESFIGFLKDDPEKVVRVRGNLARNAEEIQNIIRINKEKKETYEKMRKKYGINIPDVEIVIGPNSDRSKENILEYIVVDRIHGLPLSEAHHEANFFQDHKDELDNFLTSLVQYAWDIDKEGGYVSPDSTWPGEAIMYGRRKNETEDKFWLVDIDLPDRPKRKNPKGFQGEAVQIAMSIYNNFGDLPKMHMKMVEYIKSIPEKSPWREYSQEFLKKLENTPTAS